MNFFKMIIQTILFFGVVHSAEAKEYPGESIFNLNHEWLNRDAKTVQLKDLDGKVTAIALVYTSCQYACPMIIEEFKRVKAKINPEALGKVNFLLVSMDPQRDTPEVLKAFSSKRKIDDPIWVFYTAKDEKPVRDLSAVLGVNIKKVGKEFAHSNLITIVGPEGVIEFAKPNLGQQIEEAANVISKLASKLQKK